MRLYLGTHLQFDVAPARSGSTADENVGDRVGQKRLPAARRNVVDRRASVDLNPLGGAFVLQSPAFDDQCPDDNLWIITFAVFANLVAVVVLERVLELKDRTIPTQLTPLNQGVPLWRWGSATKCFHVRRVQFLRVLRFQNNSPPASTAPATNADELRVVKQSWLTTTGLYNTGSVDTTASIDCNRPTCMQPENTIGGQ